MLPRLLKVLGSFGDSVGFSKCALNCTPSRGLPVGEQLDFSQLHRPRGLHLLISLKYTGRETSHIYELFLTYNITTGPQKYMKFAQCIHYLLNFYCKHLTDISIGTLYRNY